MRGPFTLADARRHGLDVWNLQGAEWRRLGPGTYIAAGMPDTPLARLEAASRRLPAGAAFSGFAAAWLHGLDVPCDPIEITVPAGACVSSRAGMIVRRRAMDKGDIVKVRGFRATSVARTLRDLCARLSLTESVVLADMALHARLVSIGALKEAAVMPGCAGGPMLRQALLHVEPASESPMETR